MRGVAGVVMGAGILLWGAACMRPSDPWMRPQAGLAADQDTERPGQEPAPVAMEKEEPPPMAPVDIPPLVVEKEAPPAVVPIPGAEPVAAVPSDVQPMEEPAPVAMEKEEPPPMAPVEVPPAAVPIPGAVPVAAVPSDVRPMEEAEPFTMEKEAPPPRDAAPVFAATVELPPVASLLWEVASVAVVPSKIIPVASLAWEATPAPAAAVAAPPAEPAPQELPVASREGGSPAVSAPFSPPQDNGPEVAELVMGEALLGGQLAWVHWALKEGGAPGEFTLPGGQSALGWAVLRGDVELAELLLRTGADPNRALATPVAEELLPAGASDEWLYYLRQERNVTPLMVAAATGQENMAQALLEAGANRWAKTGRHKTTAIWLAGKWQHIGVVQMLLDVPHRDDEQEMQLRVDLSEQRVVLEKKGEMVLSSPVSTGRRGYETPPGNYVVTNKHRDWKSTLYDDAEMPYFLRLNCGAMGLHAGQLPGYPASHGCIRMPYDFAKSLFAKVPVGTRVIIQP